MKKIIFLTGTRADFGKLKSLIDISSKSDNFEVFIFCTGMHLQVKYGHTVDEIKKAGYKNIFEFINFTNETSMDNTLAKTISGFSDYVKNINPDMIIVHGDRVEALAGAIVGSLNNILVSHIEGGELSGAIDDSIRHAVTKMSHIHFVSNEEAENRVLQLGEKSDSIKIIGSPDIDILKSKKLKSLDEVQKRYNITFGKNYAVAIFHPVTTDIENLGFYINQYVNALIESRQNYIVILPNNDLGSSRIIEEYKRLKDLPRFKLFPSIRFEYFIVLLKNASYIIGNSSCGIIEAPVYGVPTINVGNRQNNRTKNKKIIQCSEITENELKLKIEEAKTIKINPINIFGTGKSNEKFLDEIEKTTLWNMNMQKEFQEII
jgi:UDP-N-acetylglucosamine 2-epimerase (hydrolysing)